MKMLPCNATKHADILPLSQANSSLMSSILCIFFASSLIMPSELAL